jgi:hypothetical protein
VTRPGGWGWRAASLVMPVRHSRPGHRAYRARLRSRSRLAASAQCTSSSTMTVGVVSALSTDRNKLLALPPPKSASDVELVGLTDDPHVSPPRILPRQAQHQIDRRVRQSPSATPDRWVGPPVRHQVPVPAQKSRWPHQEHPPPILRQAPRRHRQQHPIRRVVARTQDLPTQHRKLVAQNRDLDITSIQRPRCNGLYDDRDRRRDDADRPRHGGLLADTPGRGLPDRWLGARATQRAPDAVRRTYAIIETPPRRALVRSSSSCVQSVPIPASTERIGAGSALRARANMTRSVERGWQPRFRHCLPRRRQSRRPV